MLLCQQLAGFYQIVDSLSFICDFDRTEKNQFAFLRQPAFPAGFLLVMGFIQVGVDGIRDIDNGLSGEQPADFGFLRQPTATAYKRAPGPPPITAMLFPVDGAQGGGVISVA